MSATPRESLVDQAGHSDAYLSSQHSSRQRQEDHRFEPLPGNLARSCLKMKDLGCSSGQRPWIQCSTLYISAWICRTVVDSEKSCSSGTVFSG